MEGARRCNTIDADNVHPVALFAIWCHQHLVFVLHCKTHLQTRNGRPCVRGRDGVYADVRSHAWKHFERADGNGIGDGSVVCGNPDQADGYKPALHSRWSSLRTCVGDTTDCWHLASRIPHRHTVPCFDEEVSPHAHSRHGASCIAVDADQPDDAWRAIDSDIP